VASQVPDKNEKSLASVLKVSPYAIRDYSLALRQYPTAKLLQNVSLLKETDLKLKGVNSGSESDGQLFRELVYRLIH
jgi:DNA polymerase-3 subunit delta